MAKEEVFTCDGCGKQKGSANHWWVIKATEMDFTLLPWASGSFNNTIAKHVCGQGCAAKMMSAWMQDVANRANNFA